MVDIHSHVLPNIDDGASTLFESLDLLRLAAKKGTKKIVLTPHSFNPRIGYIDKNRIITAFQDYKHQAAEIDIELFLGSEVFCSDSFLKTFSEKNFLTINNTQYLLIEFYFNDDIERVLLALDLITKAGYIPIIAHPERYHFLMKNTSSLKQIISKGGLLQINSTSISSKAGLGSYEFAMWLLSEGYVSFVASDAHDMQHRTTNIQPSFMKIFSELSKRYAEDLFFNNPSAVISGQNINTRW